MGHPVIENNTPFAFEPMFAADEELRPVVVAIAKATYDFDGDGRLWLAEEQLPVNLAGERWSDEGISSYKYEPEIALVKLTTDVALIGHAEPQTPGMFHAQVGIKIGPVQKVARVSGDRYWMKIGNEVRLSRTKVLERVALTWENAFGGRDEAHSTPDRPAFDTRNPVGTGYGQALVADGDHVKLPNLEDPNELLSAYGDVVTPCGFGFTSPDWQPRARLAGTYDAAWERTRKPLLPTDFDRRFFNAGAPGLIAPRYLRGDEDVVLVGTSCGPRVAFRLPGSPPPQFRVVLRGASDEQLSSVLDTVIVNTDSRQLNLIWRAHTYLPGGVHDVTALTVTLES